MVEHTMNNYNCGTWLKTIITLVPGCRPSSLLRTQSSVFPVFSGSTTTTCITQDLSWDSCSLHSIDMIQRVLFLQLNVGLRGFYFQLFKHCFIPLMVPSRITSSSPHETHFCCRESRCISHSDGSSFTARSLFIRTIQQNRQETDERIRFQCSITSERKILRLL